MSDDKVLRLVINRKKGTVEEKEKPNIHPNFFAAPTDRTLGEELKRVMESKGIAWTVNDSYNARRSFVLRGERDFVYYPVERLESSGHILCSVFRIGSHDLNNSDGAIQTMVLQKDTPCEHVSGYVSISIGKYP